MEPAILLAAIPIMAIITGSLLLVSQKLYLKVYEPHISFEPVSMFKASPSRQAGYLALLCIGFMMIPLYMWAQGYAYSPGFIFLCGYTITFFTSYISRTITSILIYAYVQKHPEMMSGRTVCKSPFLQIVNAGISLQQFILVGVLSYFSPQSYFLIGALFCLGVITLSHYFSKNKKNSWHIQ